MSENPKLLFEQPLKNENKYPFTGDPVKMSLLKKHLPPVYTYWNRKITSPQVRAKRTKAFNVQMAVVEYIQVSENLTKTELSLLLGRHEGYISGCVSRKTPMSPENFNAILDNWPAEAHQALLNYDNDPMYNNRDKCIQSKPEEPRIHPAKGSIKFGDLEDKYRVNPELITLVLPNNLSLTIDPEQVGVKIDPTESTNLKPISLSWLIRDHMTMCDIRLGLNE